MPIARLLLPACLLLLSLVAAGGTEGGPEAGPGSRPVAVTTAVVQPQAFLDTLQAIGTASAHESVIVTAKVSETVQQVHFQSGDLVAKGAVLITLSGQQQQASLAEAQASANEAERLYKRQSELAAQQDRKSTRLNSSH